MKTLNLGIPTEYNIQVSASPIFECALDIAVFTLDEIHDKLERNLSDFRDTRNKMSETLRNEVRVSGDAHTWRNVLYLAHRCPHLIDSPWEQHVGLFLDWMHANEPCLPALAAPYLGDQNQAELADALSGSMIAQQRLLHSFADNPVIHLNLRYLFSVAPNVLVQHLIILVELWYKEIVAADISNRMLAFERDVEHTTRLQESMTSTELIRTITRGSELQATPNVDALWLVPQLTYRPFTIVNYLPHCVVYYYPVADEFLPDDTSQTQLAQVALLHKAIGDVQRLRLLGLLRHSPKSLAELTTILNATKSNVHHHLTLLRTAGLVQVKGGVYSIHQDAVHRVGDELRVLLEL